MWSCAEYFTAARVIAFLLHIFLIFQTQYNFAITNESVQLFFFSLALIHVLSFFTVNISLSDNN